MSNMAIYFTLNSLNEIFWEIVLSKLWAMAEKNSDPVSDVQIDLQALHQCLLSTQGVY